jgi:GT2 family glycosyltransferase
VNLRTLPAPRAAALPAPPAPTISVIVPVRNEAAFIRRTLTQLLAQDYPTDAFEVLVVDGESTDGTADIVREMQAGHANLRLLANPRRLSSAARNVGVRSARGDILLVVDGHCDVDDPHHLAEVARAFRRWGADCLGRPQPLEVEGATPLQRALAVARSSWLGHHPASFIYSDAERFVPPQSVAVAYRRHVFERVGYFDEQFDACEDVEFNHRVAQSGLSCFFTPRIRVRYHPRGTLGGLFRQMVRYGRGRVRLLRKHRATFSVPSVVPALFVAGLVAGPAAACLSPWLAAAFAAALAAYALLVLVGSLHALAGARRLSLLPWLLVVFPAIHLGTGYGALREMLRGRGRRGGASAVPPSCHPGGQG